MVYEHEHFEEKGDSLQVKFQSICDLPFVGKNVQAALPVMQQPADDGDAQQGELPCLGCTTRHVRMAQIQSRPWTVT